MERHELAQKYIDYRCGDPLEALAVWQRGGSEGRLLVVDFTLSSWWLDEPEERSLTAIYLDDVDGLCCAVTDTCLRASAGSAAEQFALWVAELGVCSARVGDILPLQPTCIPKPWGQEIWFTGVEERGVCTFGGAGAQTPIPWMQAALPGAAYGAAGSPLVLLKILDPAAEEVVGDLYFEMHEEKREVYVVTHVDRAAWPDGVGAIRYGFDPGKLSLAGSDEAFRQQYLAAVQAYETVRRQIDSGADEPGLAEQEVSLRRAMDSFTGVRELRTGDVVVVPLRMPHSLQHGVRTIEFQTPVYERKILSFAQQVLTQDHWDTAQALPDMRLLPPGQKPFEQLSAAGDAACERIVDFEDFEVRRLTVEEGGELRLPATPVYSLVMLVTGEMTVDGLQFGPEQAFLLPAGRALEGAFGPLVVLQALPRC